MRQNKLLYFIILSLIIFTGCWDVVNIEERGFVIGNAIDLVDDGGGKQPELMMTYQVVVPGGMISPSLESDAGEKPFLNYTTQGRSLFEMETKVTTLSSKIPYYEHLSVIVISEDVARKEKLFTQILDTYIRDVSLRRGIKVVVAEEEAKNILEFTSPNYKLPARHVEELLEKSSQQVGFLEPIGAGDIEEFHLKNNSYILPYLKIDNYLEYKAGAVFHGPEGKMVGLFNEEEMQGIGMIAGEHTTKVIEFLYKGQTFALDVNRFKSRMSVDPKNVDDIKVTLDIEIEGVIKELISQEDLTSPEVLRSLQDATSEDVQTTIKNVLHKAQDEYEADIFGIWQLLETKHYQKWKELRDDWETGEKYFKNVTFDINVISEIYSTGTTKKTD